MTTSTILEPASPYEVKMLLLKVKLSQRLEFHNWGEIFDGDIGRIAESDNIQCGDAFRGCLAQLAEEFGEGAT
jgi:hypothetical protein